MIGKIDKIKLKELSELIKSNPSELLNINIQKEWVDFLDNMISMENYSEEEYHTIREKWYKFKGRCEIAIWNFKTYQ